MDIHETSPLFQEAGVRMYIENKNKMIKDKLFLMEQQEAWDYEGEYEPGKDIKQNDYTRASSRIAEKNSVESCPTMIGKKRKEDLVSLPPRTRKVRQKKNAVLNCKDKIN